MRTNGIFKTLNEMHKLLWDFETQTDHLISAKKKKKKKKQLPWWIVNFAVPANHRVKLNESEKKVPKFATELKKLWNIKVSVIPIEIGALGWVTKELIQGLEVFEIRGRVGTIQATTLLRSARILRRVLVIWGDLLWLKLQ